MKPETAALLRKHGDKPFYIDGLGNDEYHSLYSISKSSLDTFAKDPASLIWAKTAPVDESKLDSVNFGTLFHHFVLENETFDLSYGVLPKVDRRTTDGNSVFKRLAEQFKDEGKTAISDDEYFKCSMMRDSLMAHPTAKTLMQMDGVAERSFFWNDDDTSLECRCRPDWLVEIKDKYTFIQSGATHIIVDLKTTRDINNISKSVEDYRYHVQDAFYSNGVESVIEFSKVDFLFIFVSTTMEIGRYPVRVVRLSDAAKLDGKFSMRENLNEIAERTSSGNWNSIVEVDRPSWATREEI